MKKELQDKLFEDFPLLYGDRNAPMTQTAMCWGCSTGNGWFDLIYGLSAKLEPLIAKIKAENENCNCETCGCAKESHQGECQTIVKCPFVFRLRCSWEVPNLKVSLTKYSLLRGLKHYLRVVSIKYWQKAKSLLNRGSCFLFERLNIHYKKKCFCRGYQVSYPRASQLKEKMGGLRLYLTSGTEEMFDLIDEATERSYTICEDCGQPGHPNDDGWISTLCDECRGKG